MSKSHATLKLFRNLHLYLGIFISPALIFFAFTGALQTFSLHETTRGSDYKPPAWAVRLGQLHKKQTLEVPVRKQAPPAAEKPKATDGPSGDVARVKGPDVAGVPAGPAPPPSPAPKQKSHLPMKIFFLLVAVSLMTSTITGLYMSYKYVRNRLVVTGLLIAGIVVPLLLLPF